MKLNAEKRQQILGALRAGADVGIAASIVNCSRQAIYALRKRDPKFADAMDEARAFADEKVVRALFKAASQEGNVTAMIFWLKNRRPDQWRDRQQVEHSGKEGAPIETKSVIDLRRLSDQQLEALEALIAASSASGDGA